MPKALIGVLAALALTACGGGGITAGPTPSPDPTLASPAETPLALDPTTGCPPPGTAYQPTHEITEVPTGAVGVRLCDLGGGLPAPEGEVTGGVDRLITQFNAAESFDSQNTTCTVDAGPAYAMVFRYPEQNPVIVTSRMGGCREVGGKFGGQELLATFEELRNDEPGASTPPAP